MKPNKIILIRHGESQGNVDKKLYGKVPDYAIYLTEKGKKQAKKVGQDLGEIIGNKTYCAYFSPYFRARQTMDIAFDQMNPLQLQFFKEEVRIREQEYAGKLHADRHDDDKEREAYGKFFYRMYGGESGADVYDRMSDFISALYRDFRKENYPENVLIFGHGMGHRMFLMRWLHTTVGDFERWKNMPNCGVYVLELQENGKYVLTTPIPCHEKGYGYHYNPPKYPANLEDILTHG